MAQTDTNSSKHIYLLTTEKTHIHITQVARGIVSPRTRERTSWWSMCQQCVYTSRRRILMPIRLSASTRTRTNWGKTYTVRCRWLLSWSGNNSHTCMRVAVLCALNNFCHLKVCSAKSYIARLFSTWHFNFTIPNYTEVQGAQVYAITGGSGVVRISPGSLGIFNVRCDLNSMAFLRPLYQKNRRPGLHELPWRVRTLQVD